MKDTMELVKIEQQTNESIQSIIIEPTNSFFFIFISNVRRSIRNPCLRAIVQAGFFNNFKDGLVW
jgi:hypothetical protein